MKKSECSQCHSTIESRPTWIQILAAGERIQVSMCAKCGDLLIERLTGRSRVSAARTATAAKASPKPKPAAKPNGQPAPAA